MPMGKTLPEYFILNNSWTWWLFLDFKIILVSAINLRYANKSEQVLSVKQSGIWEGEFDLFLDLF